MAVFKLLPWRGSLGTGAVVGREERGLGLVLRDRQVTNRLEPQIAHFYNLFST